MGNQPPKDLKISPHSRTMIIANEEALKENILVRPLHRDREIGEMVHWIRRSFHQPVLLLVYGAPGAGKTTTARWVLEKLKEEVEVPLAYVNALVVSKPTQMARIISLQAGKAMPFRGISREEMLKRLERLMPFSLIIDEADALSPKGREFVRALLKAEELFGKKVSIVLITNQPRLDVGQLTARLDFRPYTLQQLKEIVMERARMALIPDTYSEEAIAKIAAFAFKHGSNARLAIQLLRLAASQADRLTPEVVEKAKGELFSHYVERRFHGLGGVERAILEVVKEKEGITTHELYEVITRRFNMSRRMVREYVKSLIERGILSAEDYFTKRGRVRVLRVALNF